MDYWLIHGWATVPKNATQFTDPTVNLVNRSEISSHVNEQVKQYFNQQTDMLSFESRHRSGIKILGKRRIKRNVRSVTLDPQVVSSGAMDTLCEGSTCCYNTLDPLFGLNHRSHSFVYLFFALGFVCPFCRGLFQTSTILTSHVRIIRSGSCVRAFHWRHTS